MANIVPMPMHAQYSSPYPCPRLLSLVIWGNHSHLASGETFPALQGALTYEVSTLMSVYM